MAFNVYKVVPVDCLPRWFVGLVSRSLGRIKQTNYATDKPRERLLLTLKAMQKRNICSQGKYNKGIRRKKLKIH